jgi:hypothetical protein
MSVYGSMYLFMIYLAMLLVVQVTEVHIIELLLHDELDRIWMKAVMA